MGVDYSSIVVVGTKNEKDFELLPKKIKKQLKEEGDIYSGIYKDLRLFVNPYEDDGDNFICFGFLIGECNADDIPANIDTSKIKECFNKCLQLKFNEIELLHFCYVG